jgi:hypothetical protein
LLASFFISTERHYLALWVGPAQDFCHVPIFVILTFIIHRLIRGARRASDVSGQGANRSWLWALIISVIIAVLIEVLQPLVGRSRSTADFLLGMIGSGIAAIWISASPQQISIRSSATSDRSNRWRPGWRWIATLLLSIWPLVRTLPPVTDAVWSWYRYPLLAADGSWWESRRWELDRHVTLERLAIEQDESTGLRIEFPDRRPGSRAILWPVVSDWSRAQQLEIEFTTTTDRWPLLIAIRDATQVSDEQSRYNRMETFDAGRHRLLIPLDNLPIANDSPPIDTTRITMLIFVNMDRAPRELLIHRVRLVPAPDARY